MIGIISTILSLNVYAQQKLSTYNSAYFNKSFDIKASIYQNKFKLYIDAVSMDKLHEVGGFMVEESKYQAFIKALNDAKSKYQEWDQTAKQNNVKELEKEMAIKSKVGGYFLYGSDWHFQFNANLTFDFNIIESDGEINYLLILRSGKMQSSSNQYMTVDGFVLVFTSANEIQELIEAISMEKINEFKTKQKAEDLFK
jgi:hypothetical protein